MRHCGLGTVEDLVAAFEQGQIQPEFDPTQTEVMK